MIAVAPDGNIARGDACPQADDIGRTGDIPILLNGVLPAAATKEVDIVPLMALHAVRAWSPIQEIRPGSAGEHVGPVAAAQHVIPGAPAQLVIARSPEQRIVAGLPEQ